MDGDRIDEWQFWALLAIADRERGRADIRSRMAKLLRASGAPERAPDKIAPVLQALGSAGLVEKLSGGGLLGREEYRLTAAGRRACRDEIDLRRRELKVIDRDVRSWLGDDRRR